jgi:ABC-type bacteriocin/lantibiotic exporter with double-glycine peptidase domain
MIGIFMVGVGISALSTFISVRFNNRVNLSVKKAMFEKLMEKDIADIINLDVGNQQKLIEQDSAVVSGFFTTQIKDFLCAFLFAAIYLALMYVISPWLTLVSLIFIPLSILFGRFMGKRFNRYQKELWQIGSTNNTFLFDTIQKWREIKVQNLETNLSKEYGVKLRPEQSINLKWMKYFAMNGVFYDFKNSFVQSLLLYFVGGILIILGQITIGSVLMFMSYMSSFSSNIDFIINSITGFESNRAVFERLFEVLNTQIKKKESAGLNDYTIAIDKLCFAYSEELPNVLTGSFSK